MANANALVPARTIIILGALWLTARSVNAIQPHSKDWVTQGFFFDWNNPNTVLPTPITAHCETLNIHWNRAAGTGPDPIPPYFLRIYSSAVNSSVDSFHLVGAGTTASMQLTIPYPPGTLYVLCMTDSMGISGGCQDLYTVYPSNQTCSNFTAPARVLGMKATSSATGATFSRWGWPASCTDLELEPMDDKNGGIKGTPPYTLTVAPAIRPPLNITFEKSVKWTITLDHGTPFFLSVSDANGVTWTDGPLHAGEGDTSCLSQSPSRKSDIGASVTIGAAIGSFCLGALLALVCFWLFVRRHRNQRLSYRLDKTHSNDRPSRIERGGPTVEPRHPRFNTAVSNSATTVTAESHGRRKRMPDNYGPLSSHDSSPNMGRQRTPDGHASPPEFPITLHITHPRNSSSSHHSASSPTHSSSVNPPLTDSTAAVPPVNSTPPALHEVYVVHHDAGAPPPVTVYALPGSRITELPPGYNFSGGPPGNTAQNTAQPQLALVGEHTSPSPLSSTTPPRQDQKTSYTPRLAHAPSTNSLPLDSTSPTGSIPDEQTLAGRLLPLPPPIMTASMDSPSTVMTETSAYDSPASTFRARGPRPMSPPQ